MPTDNAHFRHTRGVRREMRHRDLADRKRWWRTRWCLVCLETRQAGDPRARISAHHTTVCGDRCDVDELIDWSAALAFVCIDEPPGVATRFVKASIASPLPLVSAGVGLADGYVSALLVSDADKEQYANTRDRSAPPVVSSLAMTNCVIASLMAYRGFRYLIDDRSEPTASTISLFRSRPNPRHR